MSRWLPQVFSSLKSGISTLSLMLCSNTEDPKAPLNFFPFRNISELEMQLSEPLNGQFLAQNRM